MSRRNFGIAVCLMLGMCAFLAGPAAAADVSPVIPPLAMQPLSVESAARRAAEETSLRRWKMSVVPVFASQALDAASSYGMRERNPMLAGPDGRFGARGAGIKLGATAAILGVEYLIVRKHTRAAGIFSKLNWSVSMVTAGLAAHNFAIR